LQLFKKMLNLKGKNIDGCVIFEKILEENKENINFVFDFEQYHLEEYKKMVINMQNLSINILMK